MIELGELNESGSEFARIVERAVNNAVQREKPHGSSVSSVANPE